MITIYKIENIIDGKVYIGQTKNFNNRKTKHLRGLRRGKHRVSSLQKDWDSLGEQNFKFDILEVCEDSTEGDYLERLYIKNYDSTNLDSGYNSETGGNKGKKLHERTKRKISENHADFSGENSPLFGKKLSEETRKKLSEAHKGKVLSKEHKDNIAKKFKGEGNPNSKLKAKDVISIRTLLYEGKSVNELSLTYGVSETSIRNIRNKKTWRNLI